MTTLEEGLRSLQSDIDSCIKRGVMVLEGEFSPDRTENIHTLVNLHADGIDGDFNTNVDKMYEFLFINYVEYC